MCSIMYKAKKKFVSANMLKSKRLGRYEKLFILRLFFLGKTIGEVGITAFFHSFFLSK